MLTIWAETSSLNRGIEDGESVGGKGQTQEREVEQAVH